MNANVAAVAEDQLLPPATISTPVFLGLTAPGGIWSQIDGNGAAIKGENMILGDVDLGIWPESPSYSDHVDGSGKPRRQRRHAGLRPAARHLDGHLRRRRRLRARAGLQQQADRRALLRPQPAGQRRHARLDGVQLAARRPGRRHRPGRPRRPHRLHRRRQRQACRPSSTASRWAWPRAWRRARASRPTRSASRTSPRRATRTRARQADSMAAIDQAVKRRRQRDQLLDQRRHRHHQRHGRTGVLPRHAGRRVRRRRRRQQRPGQHRQPPEPVADHGGRRHARPRHRRRRDRWATAPSTPAPR